MNYFTVPAALDANGRKKILRVGVKNSKKQNFIINMLQLINNMNFSLNCHVLESGQQIKKEKAKILTRKEEPYK